MGNYIFAPSSNTTSAAEKKERITYAAASGFVVGTICVAIGSFINSLLFPDLPLYIDWSNMFFLWMIWAVLGGALAGVAAISSEGWSSILLAAFLMAATILVINFVQGMNSFFLNILVLLGLSMPFTAMMVPVAYIFFWLARRFVYASTYKGRERTNTLAINILIIIVLGMLPGLYSIFNSKTQTGLRLVHSMLQDAAVSSDLATPLVKTEGFAEHQTQEYELSQVPSVYSTVGVDVTAHYEDGYTLKCTVVLYPGQDAYVSPCVGSTP